MALYEYAVAVDVKNNIVVISPASSGGYICTNQSDFDDFIAVIVEQKKPISRKNVWFVSEDVADFKAVGLKPIPYTSKFGKSGLTIDGDITPAQFKKLLDTCDVTVDLVKRPWPQPKIAIRLKNRPRKAAVNSTRVGR